MKLKFILIIPLFVFIQDTFGQCPRIYRCTVCNRNVDASSDPSGGNDCYDNYGNSHGHRWKFEGYRDSECQARIERERLEVVRQIDLARENCLRKSIKTYKGGNATEWYCPSGKPYSVNFKNGAIVITYFESGQIESKRYNTGQYEQYDENGQLKLKGKYNSEGIKTGEWYMEEYKTYGYRDEGVNCTNCTVTFDDNGKFLCNGTLAQHKRDLIENDFNGCKNFSDYIHHYKTYPNSKYFNEAKEKAVSFHWKEIKESWYSENYNEHMNLFNNSPFFSEAKKRYDECLSWEKAKTYTTLDNINTYINNYPNQHFGYELQSLFEEAYFNQASNEDSYKCSGENTLTDSAIRNWKLYLEKFPNGKHATFAKMRIMLMSNSSNRLQTVSDYNKKINMYQEFINNNGGEYCPCHSEFQEKLTFYNKMIIVKKAKRSPVLLYNLIVPGLGNRPLNNALKVMKDDGLFTNNKALLTTILVWGIGGTSAYLYNDSQNKYNQYLETKNSADWDGMLYDAQLKQNIAFWGFGLAGTIWALDYMNIIGKKISVNKHFKSLNSQSKDYALNITPSRNSIGLALTLTFK